MTRKRDMVTRFQQSPLPRGQSCLLVWLPLLLTSVVSDTSETLSPFPTPFRSAPSDPLWHHHVPPVGHTNHALSGSNAGRGNGDDIPHKEMIEVRTKRNNVPIPKLKCVCVGVKSEGNVWGNPIYILTLVKPFFFVACVSELLRGGGGEAGVTHSTVVDVIIIPFVIGADAGGHENSGGAVRPRHPTK